MLLVARHFWEQLGLQAILDSAQKGGVNGELSDRALALVANRLCEPTSEHGIARWLETDYVCDRSGRRWLPEWRDDAERLASRRPRVRVKDRQLRQWYGTLDRLVAQKKSIEKELFLRLRSLFALNVDLVFYDLTSTYFEGNGPAGLALHGHSRDGKPRNRQILVGQVMIDGWPIAHHVFEGNKRDSVTVAQVLDDIQKRFGLRRVVFVGDRGMVTSDNIDLLRSREQGYVVGLNRRRRPEVLRYVERATGPWLDCPAGIAASEKSGSSEDSGAGGEVGQARGESVCRAQRRTTGLRARRTGEGDGARAGSIGIAGAESEHRQAESPREDRRRSRPDARTQSRVSLLRLEAGGRPVQLLRTPDQSRSARSLWRASI